MTATTRSRLKWEVAIGGIVIAVVMLCRDGLAEFFLDKELKGILAQQRTKEDDKFHQKKFEEDNKRQEASVPRGSVSYPYYKWEPRPLDKLKYVLSWKPGEVSLRPVGYVDGVRDSGIEPPKAGQITVLLINDSNNILEIPTQDGDIFLKLEVNLEGKWRRAQWHGYSRCGNSYVSCTLPPHTYAPVLGYRPTVGRIAKVRYVIKNGAQDPLMSEEFEGVFSSDDVAMSAFDQMAFHDAPLEDLRAFVAGRKTPELLPLYSSLAELRISAQQALSFREKQLSRSLSEEKRRLHGFTIIEKQN